MSTVVSDAEQARTRKRDSSAADGAELFDSKQFQLPIPKLDGTKADKLELKVTGSIALDPTSEADLALINSLMLDQDVTLHLEAQIAGKAFKVARGEDETTATHVITAKAHTLYRTPFEIQEED